MEQFHLDSTVAKAELKAFLARHNNLSLLANEVPDVAPGLGQSSKTDLAEYVRFAAFVEPP